MGNFFISGTVLHFAAVFTAGGVAVSHAAQSAQPLPASVGAASPATDSSVSGPLAVILSPGPYYVGGVISATIVVPNASVRPQLDLRPIRDFEAQIFDAAPRPDSKSFVFRLNLLPKKPGSLRVPALNIAGAGRRRTTAPFALEVLEPEPATDMSLTATLSESVCHVGQPLTLEVTWTSGAAVSTIQAVDLRIPLLEHPDYKSRDFAALPKEFGLPIGLPVGNGRMIGGYADRTIRLRKIVVPQKAGTYAVTGAAVLCSVVAAVNQSRRGLGTGFQYAPQYDNQFFSDAESVNARRLYARSPPLTIRVQPLPAAGKPAEFSGIVGAFSLQATVDPSVLREGEPLTLTVGVRDYAYPEVLDLPPFATLPGFRGRFRIPAERGVPTLVGTDHGVKKIFRQSFRPVSTGVDKVPAIAIPYFDAATATYRFATAPEMPLRVLPHAIATGFDAILSDGSRLKNILVARGPAMGPNFSRDDLLRPPLAAWTDTAGFWWVALGVPPIVGAALLRATRRRRWRRLLPERERILWAYPDFIGATRRVADPAELTGAVRAYLGRRVGVAVVTFGAVEERLRVQGVAGSDLQQLREVLAAGDRRDFSARGGNGEPGIVTRESVRALVASIEAALARRRSRPAGLRAFWSLVAVGVFCRTALPLRAALPAEALAEAEALFQAGIAQRFDHPEAANDALHKAAAGFEYLLGRAEPGWERGKLHYNAGAARFFAGDIGRAVYHLRQAERVLPADRRVRSALAYLRAQRADSSAETLGRRFWDWFSTAADALNPLSWKLVLAALYTLFWVLVLVAAFRPSRSLRRLAAATLFTGAGLGMFLCADAVSERLKREGVVLEPELIARKGPAPVYEPAFETPIHTGVEFRVVGESNDWLEISIPGTDESCWIPTNSAALLDP